MIPAPMELLQTLSHMEKNARPRLQDLSLVLLFVVGCAPR